MALSSEHILSVAVRVLEEKKAVDTTVLNLQGISLIADYFVICSGNSEMQVKAIADAVKKEAHKNQMKVRSVEGLDSARWVLIDLGDVVLHIFHREDREYYHIERLWSDAKIVELA